MPTGSMYILKCYNDTYCGSTIDLMQRFLEDQLKKWSRKKKRALIKDQIKELEILSKKILKVQIFEFSINPSNNLMKIQN